MCEVCAVFGRGGHWTARASSVSTVVESVDLRFYRTERRQALALVNAILLPQGLVASDWDGEAYEVSGPTGASVKAENLADVWATPSRLGALEIDPLSPGFLAGHA